MPCSVETIDFLGRSGIKMSNGLIELIVLAGGGHLASLRLLEDPVNPLWVPPWPTVDPALRRVADPRIFPPGAESELLACIVGHNLCLDVFGGHSAGEMATGMSFHGEAGLVHWEVSRSEVDTKAVKVVWEANLRHSQLRLRREIMMRRDELSVEIREHVKNLAGFQRCMGVAQHVTLGEEFLQPGCSFAANTTRGMTWPEAVAGGQSPVPGQEFLYPNIPLEHGASMDFRCYPRKKNSGALYTLQVDRDCSYGWFSAVQSGSRLGLAYAWRRKDYPWLMNWEEYHSRLQPPWSGRTLTRGLEFSSYAFPTSRADNVERSRLFETPCFEWLDAYAEKDSQYHAVVFRAGSEEAPPCKVSARQVAEPTGLWAVHFD